MKNKIKTVFGSHSYTHYDEKKQQDQGEQLAQDDFIDDNGKKILMD